MGFRLQQKPMILNDLERQIYWSVVSVMRVVTKRLGVESRGFRYRVALLSQLSHIKFDDEIKRNPFEFKV